jgi:hypothetical protein
VPDNKSLIRDRTFISQIKEFSGLRFGSIYPTDIDGFLDFRNKLFIFIEIKHGFSELKGGQKLAIERLCDSCQTSMRDSFAIVAFHESVVDIDVSLTIVRSIRYRGEWKKPKNTITVRQAIIQIRNRWLKGF